MACLAKSSASARTHLLVVRLVNVKANTGSQMTVVDRYPVCRLS